MAKVRDFKSCHVEYVSKVFSALTLLDGGSRKGIQPVKTEQWGAGMVICLERGAHLHMAHLMPLPLNGCVCARVYVSKVSRI